MYDKKQLDELRKSLEQWEETSLSKALASLPERRDEFITTSSEPIDRLYTPLDVAEDGYASSLGLPGEYPFTRGVHPTLHRSKLWTMRMFAGFGTAEETNQRFKYLLEQGQTGLSVAFDLATLMGYDTDQPEALGEFGKCGVAISSLKDMEILLDGIPLDKVSTSMTINSPAAIIWAMYIAAAEKQGVRPDQLRGTIQNDILKEYVARGTYIGFIGSGDEWIPEKLAEELATFSHLSPEFGVVYSDLWEITRAGERRYWQNPEITGPELINSDNTDYQINYLGNGPILVRREFFDLAGAFDRAKGQRLLGGARCLLWLSQAVAQHVKLPQGYNIVWSGQYEYMEQARARLLVIIPLTVLIIFVIIYTSTKSLVKTAIVFLAVPFSLVGAFWLLYLLDYNTSIAVWVGIIALAGLDAETGVVMLLYLDLAYQQAIDQYDRAVQYSVGRDRAGRVQYLLSKGNAYVQWGSLDTPPDPDRLELGIQNYLEAIQAQPGSGDVWRIGEQIARLYMKLLDKENALTYAQLALEKAPEEYQGRITLLVTEISQLP